MQIIEAIIKNSQKVKSLNEEINLRLNKNLLGDSVILAASITYFGIFDFNK
jgi:hypothetical protein